MADGKIVPIMTMVIIYLVPVQNDPFIATTISLFCECGKMGKEFLAISEASVLLQDEQIFKVNTGLTNKGRKVVEEQSKSNRNYRP
jgi:hypothetical protein